MTARSAIATIEPGPHTPTLITDCLLLLGRHLLFYLDDGKEVAVATSRVNRKSPPTGQVMDALTALSDSPRADLGRARQLCGITTSTCALVLAELEPRLGDPARGSPIRAGQRIVGADSRSAQAIPAARPGARDAALPARGLNAGCSMSRTAPAPDDRRLGRPWCRRRTRRRPRFPIGPPFGLVAMAWHDADFVHAWLHRVTPRLTQAESTP